MSRRSSTAPESPAAKCLHIDAFSGAAGNMFVAALLDAGLSRRALDAGLAGLGLDFKLTVKRVKRGALAARYLDVRVPKKAANGRVRYVSGNEPARPGQRPGHVHGRSYAQIRALLAKASLSAGVRDRAQAIFEALARAEAHVHGTKLEAVHFHEVGAVDAIVDVTAAAVGLEALGIERVTCSAVALGQGSVETAHGRLPLPAPATLQLLKGIPTEPAHVAWETVTPTGAAILRTVVDEFCAMPAMTVEAIGHGAGGDRDGPMPNVLRAVIGRSGGPKTDRVVALETNLDDFVPEHFDHLMERLFEAGALDVGLQHLQMKKNRPGFLVRVLARPADRLALAQILFAESTAIGVRTSEWDRLVLRREKRRVDTRFGRIAVKVVWSPDGEPRVSPEYDDCKRAAKRNDASLREVVAAAEAAARAEFL
jgi:uncharacterized protein (TIGR00299 family) protein